MHPNILNVSIEANQFSPIVLKSSLFSHVENLPKNFKLEERYVFDYELEYILYSEGSMVIEGINYPMNKGDIIFRKPGQLVQGIMPYSCYLICFDLLGNTGKDPLTYDFSKENVLQNNYLNNILDSIPSIINNPYEEKYHKIFESVFKEYITMDEGSGLLLKSYLLQIIYHLYMDIKNPFVSNNIPANSHYITIKKVIEFIKIHLTSNLNLDTLAAHVDLSPSHFHKIFKSVMNITPNEYITKLRLDKAKEMLVKSDMPVCDVALHSGFENIPYFSYLFKKSIKMTPGEFRKIHNYI